MSGTQHPGSGKPIPKFPTKQMTILALCRICEPIAFMSIFPYIYYMIRDFEVTNQESEIPVYAGMVTSAFAFAEFSSGVAWGKLSDRIGRKPVLLTGLAGTALSMLVFGFAPNLPVALLARALGGLLNGNIGVLQTTVAEMVTVKEHQPRAYTIMPFVWCLGSIVGPMLGGALAKPVDSWPTVFVPGSIWDRFPYLLPNLFCTIVVTIGVVIGILFLEETHEEKKYRHDPGLEAGKWIISKLTSCAETKSSRGEKVTDVAEVLSLLSEDEQPPGYQTTEGSPNLPSTPSPEPEELLDLNESISTPRPKPTTSKAFTRQVILNIVGYGILAYHTITFDSMLPTFLSTPSPSGDEIVPIALPFKFVGGYGLDTRQIGVVLSVQGIYSMIATVFLFPIFVRRLGALGLFRLIAISYPVLYITTPYLVLLPDSLRMVGVYVVVIWKCTCSTMAYPSNAILLTNSAPSLLLLGTINGVAASTASLCRAFGPTVSGWLFSAGLSLGYSGLAWWCSALITVAGAVLSLSMTDKGGRMDVDEKSEEDAEMGFEDHILDHKALDSALAAAEPRPADLEDDETDRVVVN
ncbi:MFS general substrate transporter [Venustampulla echinocandica]|uniref:MFS general substrate transporter n=1 Tax=Venustampulla echinocandica TaxID=2656787 RepID=A0A370TJY2_9HELO|nr:MFS general substrate transporter [Venustampulla echinocandica]RDL35819.1 MFS general substrate transporter [Venustampulla echinocandica]